MPLELTDTPDVTEVTITGTGELLGPAGDETNADITGAAPGGEVELTAKVTCPSGDTPTGTVTFLEGDAEIGTPELGENGAATLTTTRLSGGEHRIVARYPGSSRCTASTTAPVTVTPESEPSSDTSLTVDPSGTGQSRIGSAELGENGTLRWLGRVSRVRPGHPHRHRHHATPPDDDATTAPGDVPYTGAPLGLLLALSGALVGTGSVLAAAARLRR